MSLIDDWNKTINTFAANRNHSGKHQSNKNQVAHFCEHRDIRIFFTPAKETWLAHIPSGIKPWWVFLNPLLNQKENKPEENQKEENKKENPKQNKDNKNITITDEPAHGVGIEVTENA